MKQKIVKIKPLELLIKPRVYRKQFAPTIASRGEKSLNHFVPHYTDNHAPSKPFRTLNFLRWLAAESSVICTSRVCIHGKGGKVEEEKRRDGMENWRGKKERKIVKRKRGGASTFTYSTNLRAIFQPWKSSANFFEFTLSFFVTHGSLIRWIFLELKWVKLLVN